MKIVIHPKYEFLRTWLEELPATFEQQGEVIYEERNQIRRMPADGMQVVVKRFHTPNIINRIAYTLLCKPKAVRAYENAVELKKRGICTPEPIGYLLCGNGLLKESYLVTLQSDLTHTFYDFRDGKIAGKEDLIEAFAQYAASLHNHGVLHKDFSPGNILYGQKEGTWQFELVDINRMRFGYVSPKEGCYNLCRLWGKSDFFETLCPVYAKARGIDEAQCLAWIQEGRKRFWAHHAHEHFVNDDTFSVGIIISAYNKPEWLEKVFWGLMAQTHPADEIIVADDGSDERTAALVKRYADMLPLQHVWQEDKGFRKTEILNKAVLEAKSEYLIFMDQDVVPRRDFVSQHYRHAAKGRFISGGAVMLSKELSEVLTKEDIQTGKAFDITWLTQHGMAWNWKMSKLWRNALVCQLMNILTPTKASWNGGNASTWREYIIRANGFDSRMRYGAEDREFGQRLENAGIRGIQLRYGTPLLHLYHERPYRNEEDWNKNKAIWRETKQQQLTKTAYGIQ